MYGERSKILIDSIKRLLRRNAITHLRKMVNKTHAADLAIVFRSLSLLDQHKLLDLIEDISKKGALFGELDEETLPALVEGLELDYIVKILEHTATDDVADLLGLLPDEKSDAILKRMKEEGKSNQEIIEELNRTGIDPPVLKYFIENLALEK